MILGDCMGGNCLGDDEPGAEHIEADFRRRYPVILNGYGAASVEERDAATVSKLAYIPAGIAVLAGLWMMLS
jgi:hypothetical protein